MIDGLTHEETRRIQVGNGSRGLFIVGKEKYLLVSNSGSDTLSVVDLEYGEEIRQIEIGRDPRHMIVADGFAYISLWGRVLSQRSMLAPSMAVTWTGSK